MFKISGEQSAKITDWLNKNWPNGLPYGGAIGGHLTYSFTPTSIGIVTKVKCLDKELDVSDYENW